MAVIFMVDAPYLVKWLVTLPLWHIRCRYGWGRPSHCLQTNLEPRLDAQQAGLSTMRVVSGIRGQLSLRDRVRAIRRGDWKTAFAYIRPMHGHVAQSGVPVHFVQDYETWGRQRINSDASNGGEQDDVPRESPAGLSRRLRPPMKHYWILAPESLTAFPQSVSWESMCFANASGVEPTISYPLSLSWARTLGTFAASAKALLSFCTMASGVPAGARNSVPPIHDKTRHGLGNCRHVRKNR